MKELREIRFTVRVIKSEIDTIIKDFKERKKRDKKTAYYTTKELRKKNKLTVKVLSETTGVKAKKIENGITERVYATNIAKLENYFKTCEIMGLTV